MNFTPYLKLISKNFKSKSKSKLKVLKPFNVLIISAHPDDECLQGQLAFILQDFYQATVTNVTCTLGSNQSQHKRRKKEMTKASKFLGLNQIFLKKFSPQELKIILNKIYPDLIICHHHDDHHLTHIKTQNIFLEAIKKSTLKKSLILWSHFWGELKSPNVIIETPLKILNKQMRGLTHHKGEVKRNPYHLHLPAMQMNEVRLAEKFLGTRIKNPHFPFAMRYQLNIYQNKKIKNIILKHQVLDNRSNTHQILRDILDAASSSKTK